MKGLVTGRGGKGVKVYGGMGRGRRVQGREGTEGEGRLDMDICPGAAEFLVTPLNKLLE